MDCSCSLYALTVTPCQHARRPVLVEPKHLSYLLRQDTWSSHVTSQERELEDRTRVLRINCRRISESAVSIVSSCIESENMTIEHLKDVLTRQSLRVPADVKLHIKYCSNHQEILQCISKTINWYGVGFLDKFLNLFSEGRNNDIQNVRDEVQIFKEKVNRYVMNRVFKPEMSVCSAISGRLKPIACVKMDPLWSTIPAQDIGRVYNRVRETICKTTGQKHVVRFCSVLHATVLEVDQSLLVCRQDCIQPCAPPSGDVLMQARMVAPCSKPYPIQCSEPEPLPDRIYLPSGSAQIHIKPPDPSTSHDTTEPNPQVNDVPSDDSSLEPRAHPLSSCLTPQSFLHPFHSNAGKENHSSSSQ